MEAAAVPVDATRRHAAFAFILVTVLLDMLCLGIVIPVLPKLVVDFTAGDTEKAARIFGIFGATFALMQFLFSPIRGVLSDRFGRRPLVLISNFGVAIDYTLMALAPTVAWVFAGRVISGITAGNIPIGYAYAADVTQPDSRAARFALLGAAISAGFIFGPALGGYASTISPRLPFWIATGLSLVNAGYGILVLPESLPRSRRAAFRWQRANPLGALVLLRSHRELFGLAWVNFLINLAQAGLPSVGVLYMSYRYGWDERVIGLTMASFSVAAIIVQGVVVAPVTRRIGERAALALGLAFGGLGFLVLGMAWTGPAFWLGIPFVALWGLANPALLALMSRSVGGSEQGLLQGANSSIMGIAGLFGPVLLTQTFAFAIGAGRAWQLPGAPFLIATTLLLLAGITAWRVTRA
jgi:DHA1 family tetracycline resistance protein-like MFS transporter